GRSPNTPHTKSTTMWVSSASTVSLWRRGPRTASRPPDRETLVCAPAPDHRNLGVIDSPHAGMNVLSRIRCIGPTGDLVLAGLIGEPIADPKQHRKDSSCARWIGRRHPG